MDKVHAGFNAAFRTTKEKLLPFITTRRNPLITLYLPVSGTLPPLFVSVRWLLQHYLVVKNGQHIPPYKYFYEYVKKWNEVLRKIST